MGCVNNCVQCSKFPCSCSTNFWILPSGDNLLKGCECDPDNPIRLQDCFIVHALRHSCKARDDFELLCKAFFPCEKERFEILFADNPWAKKKVMDPMTVTDMFQSVMNKRIPVYTSGPQGGRRLPRANVAQTFNFPPELAPKRQPVRCDHGDGSENA